MTQATKTAKSDPGLTRVVRWEDYTTWPLFVGALLFFGCFTLILVDPHPSATVRSAAGWILVVLWLWFFADYMIRLVLSGHARKRFVRTRVFDLVSLALPILRPLLVIIYVWRLPALRHGNAARQRLRYALVTVLFAFIYVYVASYLVWAVEKNSADANILNFGDAVWWGFSTLATVGYGDFVPVTGLGRTLAVGLMIGGIVILGFVTATLLSSLTDRIKAIATKH